jgi:1-deoxy-D-xylulose-5-phosphate synthase
MYTVQHGIDFPIAIRYPRVRDVLLKWKLPFETIEIGKGICLNEGKDIAILSVGTTVNTVNNVIENNPEFENIGHYDMRFVKPLDVGLLNIVLKRYKAIISIEDGTIIGGFGSALLEFANSNNYKTKIEILGIKDQFTEHGIVNELKKVNDIDEQSLKKKLDNLILSLKI